MPLSEPTGVDTATFGGYFRRQVNMIILAARLGRVRPTFQACSACGVLDGPKPLHVRSWTCTACGTVHDRDLNAAKNILAAGRAERLNACGAGVRPGLALAAGSEAGTHRGAA